MPSVHRCSTQKPVFLNFIRDVYTDPFNPDRRRTYALSFFATSSPSSAFQAHSSARCRLQAPHAARSLALRPIFGPFRRTSAVTSEPISANRGGRRRGRVGSRFERSARESHLELDARYMMLFRTSHYDYFFFLEKLRYF